MADEASDTEALAEGARCQRSVVLTHDKGLHLRPATRLSEAAKKYASDIRIKANDKDVAAKSIIELMSLAAECGTELVIEAEGPDAEAAVGELVAMVQNRFGFGAEEI